MMETNQLLALELHMNLNLKGSRLICKKPLEYQQKENSAMH